jgi:tRNA threonylcarbamoyladenosine biosynthesis protein TsaE
MLIKARSLDELNLPAEALIEMFENDYRVVLLRGDMGSGKTTFVKALCQLMGVMEPVTSPTFSLIQEYKSPSYGLIYHMDFYRLRNEGEIIQLGLEEYLDSGQICLIEWPDIAKSYFNIPYIDVEVSADPHNIRNFKIIVHDQVDT